MAHIDWAQTRRPGRYWRVALDGTLAGLIVVLLFVIRGNGEPSATTQLLDYIIWFAVLAVMGTINSLAIYGINALVSRRTTNLPIDKP